MLLGEIVGAFGVCGEAKMVLHTDYPQRFSSLKSVFLGPEHREWGLEGTRLHKGQALLQLEGVRTPEDVSRLRGLTVWVPRAEAVALSPGQYYLDDLIGVTVRTESGRELGPVTDVLRTGSNDVYVLGQGRAERLIPGVRDAVCSLDLETRVMIVADWVLISE